MSKQGSPVVKKPSLWARLGPGLITGVADDDPSGIATYSQVGAGLDYGILWKAEEVEAVSHVAVSAEARHQMIAVAAFYLAELRGFAGHGP